MAKKNKKILGLALGGGSLRGLAHVGVLKVIEEYRIKIDYLAGTSIGSIIGALYADGMTVKEIIAVSRRIKWNNFYQFSFQLSGLSNSKAIDNLIKTFIKHDSFSKLKIPFSVTASNITKGKMVVIKSGSLSSAIQMSASFPGIYTPVIQKNEIFCDGGVFCNLPVQLVKKMGAEIIVGVDVIPKSDMDPKKNKTYTMLNIMDRSLDLMLKEQIKELTCDLLMEPVNQDINSFDLKKKEDLMKMGEKCARETLLPFLRKRGFL
ncbi:MAG: patatin-like phospholipase family protein [Candidatus Margulisbacteria bacterium]|nr:patatin-like phospholipase family protein [Candidatus Margulisiibacteriota bacterium]